MQVRNLAESLNMATRCSGPLSRTQSHQAKGSEFSLQRNFPIDIWEAETQERKKRGRKTSALSTSLVLQNGEMFSPDSFP